MPALKICQAIFETVAPIGLTNLSKSDRPDSEVIFEHRHTLTSTVKKALHMVALDDKRKAFQTILMNPHEHILGVWFSGACLDVGAGYYQDGTIKGVSHQIIYPSGECLSAKGLKHHIILAKITLKTFKVSESNVVSILAYELNNHTAVMLEKKKLINLLLKKHR